MNRKFFISTFLAVTVVGIFALLASSLYFETSLPCAFVSTSDARVAAYRGITTEMVQRLRLTRSLTNREICAMPESKLERASFRAENPKPDRPGEAALFRMRQQQDEYGNIPQNGLIKAQEHADEMPRVTLRDPISGDAGKSPSTANAPDITPATWVWKGPGNIGGRVRSIVIHPTQTDRMWAGAVSGGIWYTSNGGASWAIVDDFMTTLAVSTMVMDPTDADTLYAGTGEGFYNFDAIRGAGVFTSTNGGVNWTQLASTANSSWFWVNRLAISPDGNTLLAATRSGIYLSANEGITWTQAVTSTQPFSSNMYDVDFHPTDSNKAVASGPNGYLYYSTNGGQNWTSKTLGPSSGRVEVAYAPSDGNYVYASADINNGEVWRSTDGGVNFYLRNSGENYLGNQGWYDNVIWVDPTNRDIIVVGGIDLWGSDNGGTDLIKLSTWYYAPYSAHADHHAITEHPNYDGSSNRTVFFGNDGGVYKKDDLYNVSSGLPPNGWVELNNQLGITQFYGADGNVTSGTVVGGTQDNGTVRYAGGTESWSMTFSGDGGFVSADQTNSNYFYGEYTYANAFRSSDSGTSAEFISGYYYNDPSWVWKSSPYKIPDAETQNANFIAPLLLDPNHAQRLLVGGDQLWRTNDARTANTPTTGPTWASIKSSISSHISAIDIADGNSDIIWVGYNNGNVYSTTNGTDSSPVWVRVDLNSPGLPNRQVLSITIDPANHDIAYVTFGGFNSDNVWRTANGGSSWSDISGSGGTSLPSAPVRSLEIHPDDASRLYIGSEVGIFASMDTGANWALPHGGPSNVSVDELFWMDRKLMAATHGRGIYEIDQRTLWLVSQSANWKYLDDGTDQGTSWRSSGFDDSGWAQGFAEMGYGDGDEYTVVSFGSDPENKYRTTYFRREFSIGDASKSGDLLLNIRRDDGAVVYLNGVEVARSNMPTGSVDYQTLATVCLDGSDEEAFFGFFVDGSQLVNGDNLLAVEIHQCSDDSPDISFDLSLLPLGNNNTFLPLVVR